MMTDCSFQNADGFFRLRAAAIIIEEGHVLMIKNPKDPYYYAVGGGVHLHECAEDAVKREILEETGLSYEIDRLAFVHENFFKGFLGDDSLKCHEIALYFLMKPKGKMLTPENKGISQTGERERAFWLPIKSLDQLHLFPTFFKERLSGIGEAVEHIITYE
jgi:ADP-ribose pyrophosphatase YjhB (NUDIX family)